MNIFKKYKLIVLMFFMLIFSVPAIASPLTVGNIVSFSDVTVQADEHVKSILIVGADAHISGYVDDEVVIINGNAFLSSNAKVKDHVVVLGGKILAEEGAFVREGIIQFGGELLALNSLLIAGLMVSIIWFVQFIVTVALLVIPIVTVWLRQNLIEEIRQVIKDHKIKAGVLGILGIIASLIIIAIFSLSVIGIPVALMLFALMLVVIALGLGAISSSIGDSLSNYINIKNSKTYFSVLVGSLLIALIFNIPLIGLLVLCVVMSVGFGGVLIKLGTKKV